MCRNRRVLNERVHRSDLVNDSPRLDCDTRLLIGNGGAPVRLKLRILPLVPRKVEHLNAVLRHDAALSLRCFRHQADAAVLRRDADRHARARVFVGDAHFAELDGHGGLIPVCVLFEMLHDLLIRIIAQLPCIQILHKIFTPHNGKTSLMTVTQSPLLVNNSSIVNASFQRRARLPHRT